MCREYNRDPSGYMDKFYRYLPDAKDQCYEEWYLGRMVNTDFTLGELLSCGKLIQTFDFQFISSMT